jgi:hypothetical protein
MVTTHQYSQLDYEESDHNGYVRIADAAGDENGLNPTDLGRTCG